MTFKVTILGSGAALPSAGKHHSAHALNVHEQFYLIDCGEGTQSRLMENGISPMKINAVFLSHLHGDHVYGIFPLISTMGLLGRERPLKLFAPYPMGEVLECNRRYFESQLPFEVQYTEVNTREAAIVYENNVMQVSTVPLRHRVPSVGYIFREKEPGLNVRKEAIEFYGLGVRQIVSAKRGEDVALEDGRTIENSKLTYRPYSPRAYAYCSDTMTSGKVASLVEGVDLLYHEATFAEMEKSLAKETGHSTAIQAASVAEKAGVGRLIIGHISARYKDEELILGEARSVFPATELAREGTVFSIDPNRG